MLAYILLIQDKVKAWNEYLSKQERLNELETIINEAKSNYELAVKWKEECIQSWNEQMNKEHDLAENARNEMNELKGFLMNR